VSNERDRNNTITVTSGRRLSSNVERLRDAARRSRALAEEFDKRADAVAARENRRVKPPQPEIGDGCVYLTFKRPDAVGRELHDYAAVGWRIGNGRLDRHGETRRYAVTGRSGPNHYTWDGLLNLVGERNWGSLRIVTATEPLAATTE